MKLRRPGWSAHHWLGLGECVNALRAPYLSFGSSLTHCTCDSEPLAMRCISPFATVYERMPYEPRTPFIKLRSWKAIFFLLLLKINDGRTIVSLRHDLIPI